MTFFQETFPCALNVVGRRCLVIGNNWEAREKAARLREAGARVKVNKRSFRESNLKGVFFVILSILDDVALTKRLARACKRKRILLCAIDQPRYCDVYNVSIFSRGLLKVAISTSGAAPSVAKKMRIGLEKGLKKVPIEKYLDQLARLRSKWEKDIPDPDERRKRLIACADGFKFDVKMKLPRKAPKSR